MKIHQLLIFILVACCPCAISRELNVESDSKIVVLVSKDFKLLYFIKNELGWQGVQATVQLLEKAGDRLLQSKDGLLVIKTIRPLAFQAHVADFQDDDVVIEGKEGGERVKISDLFP